MLGKHILGYVPSLVVPAAAAFASVYAYTRMLTPEEYGQYTLTINAMTLLIAVFYYWLQVSLPRLLPQAIREAKAIRLQVTAYVAFGLVCVLLILSLAVLSRFTAMDGFRSLAWLTLALTFARAFLNLNQAFHRSNLDFKRYNIIECGQAVIGLGVGLWLVWAMGRGFGGAVMGMIAGALCMGLLDIGKWIRAPFRLFDAGILKEISHFGLPLVLGFGLSVVISTSDRFLIGYFDGAEQVGVYAAGYTLMDRIITIVFMMIAMPSFPLTVHKFEQEGFEAARMQTYRNGVAALMLALPASAGLILTNQRLAEVFIGPAFREGAMKVMPWIAVSGLLNGLSTHYFDHAFHLGKRTILFAFTLGPAALFNVVLNLLLIPRYGYIGAAWSTLASYALLLALSIGVGRRVFPVAFPFASALKIFASVLMMSIVLCSVPAPGGWTGLVIMVMLGGITYGLGLLLLDVADARGRLQRLFTHMKQ